jgi:hypothetical protein
MTEQLILFQKLYDLVIAMYPVINHIPKSHRMVLGRHLEDSCIVLLLLVVKANKTKDANRKLLQDKISDDLDSLRIMVRLIKDLRFLSIKQYANLVERLNEIGKMVYCWSRV